MQDKSNKTIEFSAGKADKNFSELLPCYYSDRQPITHPTNLKTGCK